MGDNIVIYLVGYKPVPMIPLARLCRAPNNMSSFDPSLLTMPVPVPFPFSGSKAPSTVTFEKSGMLASQIVPLLGKVPLVKYARTARAVQSDG